jgi:hypothetical protein
VTLHVPAYGLERRWQALLDILIDLEHKRGRSLQDTCLKRDDAPRLLPKMDHVGPDDLNQSAQSRIEVQIPSRPAHARQADGEHMHFQPDMFFRRISRQYSAKLMPAGRYKEVNIEVAARRKRIVTQPARAAADTGMSDREYLQRSHTAGRMFFRAWTTR